jgi:hypothetical protein
MLPPTPAIAKAKSRACIALKATGIDGSVNGVRLERCWGVGLVYFDRATRPSSIPT